MTSDFVRISAGIGATLVLVYPLLAQEKFDIIQPEEKKMGGSPVSASPAVNVFGDDHDDMTRGRPVDGASGPGVDGGGLDGSGLLAQWNGLVARRDALRGEIARLRGMLAQRKTRPQFIGTGGDGNDRAIVDRWEVTDQKYPSRPPGGFKGQELPNSAGEKYELIRVVPTDPKSGPPSWPRSIPGAKGPPKNSVQLLFQIPPPPKGGQSPQQRQDQATEFQGAELIPFEGVQRRDSGDAQTGDGRVRPDDVQPGR